MHLLYTINMRNSINHHQELVQMFLKRILNTKNLFAKYRVDKLIYPVVLGGVDVLRCCKGKSGLTTADIDIKFIVVPSVANINDPTFQLALAMRARFVQEVVDLANASGLLGLTKLHISEVDPKLSFRMAVYEENVAMGTKEVLVDTGIFCDYTKSDWKQFRNFFDNAALPVPVYVSNHIPYATCSWTLVDTVRMLKHSRDMYESNKSMFWRNKYVKYVQKFAAIYKSYNNVPGDEHMTRAIEIADELLNAKKASSATASTTELKELVEKYTNEPSIETHLAKNTNVNICVKSILHYILLNTLGKYMKATKEFYPVVLGGAGVVQCVSKMFQIDLKDVDLQFVLANADKEEAAVVAKNALVKSIVSDAPLLAHVKQLGSDHGLEIELSIFEKWQPSSKQDDMHLSIVEVVLKEAGSTSSLNPFKRVNIMDCMVVGAHVEPFKHVPTFEKDPVSGVLYASCDFVYENTRTMLMLMGNMKINNKNGKYLRYVLKYLALYMSRHEKGIKHAKMLELKRNYRELTHLIRGDVLRDGNMEARTGDVVNKILKLVGIKLNKGHQSEL